MDIGEGVFILDIIFVVNVLFSKIVIIIFEVYVFEEMWNDIRKFFKRLKYEKIVENNFVIKLLDERKYKEVIFNIVNDKLFIVFGIFGGIEENIDYIEKIISRVELIVEKLNKYNIMNN